MGIVPNFNNKAIEEYMLKKQKLLDTLIIRNLNYLGMKCVVLARTLDTYKDRTANLRNSIGYVVVKDGKITRTQFESQGRGEEWSSKDEEGEKVGLRLAKELAKEFSEGYALIVVAGMEYASYVEDVHGLDVLRPSENLAKSELDTIAKGIISSMSKAV